MKGEDEAEERLTSIKYGIIDRRVRKGIVIGICALVGGFFYSMDWKAPENSLECLRAKRRLANPDFCYKNYSLEARATRMHEDSLTVYGAGKK